MSNIARDVDFNVTASDKTGAALAAAERRFAESQKRINQINKDYAAKRQKDLDESAAKIGRRLENVLGKAAPKLAESLAQSLSASGPAIGAAALAVAPAIGAVISAGVIGAAGAGGIIGGVLLASRDPRVQAAGKKLGVSLLGQLEKDAAPFVEPVLKVIDTVENRFQQMNGRISNIFSKSSGFLAPIVDGALDGVDGILRGVDALVRRGQPVMESFGRAFSTIGDSIGNALETISGGSEDAATALDYTARTIGATIEATGYLVRGLTELFGVITYIPSKLLLVSDALSRLTGIGQQYNLGAEVTANASTRASDAVAGLVNKAQGLYYAYSSSGEAMDRTNQYLADSEKAMADAAKAASDLVTANKSLYDSETNLGAAIDAATKSRRENGRTLDANTEKGRANRDALSGVAAAARAEYDAFVKVNGEGPKSAAVAENLRGKFVALAQKLGASKNEANNLANSILGIPSNKNVKIEAKSNAAQVSRETKDALNSIHSKTVSLTVNVNASRLASIENRLNRLGGSMYNAAGTSWAALDSNSGTARTGGPTPVSVSSNVAVTLDGAPFYAMTVRAAEARAERDAWRQKVGANLMAVAINTVTQDVYPPRVSVAVTGLTLGDQLEVLREVAGNRTQLRGGYVFSATDTGYVIVDAELPFGIPVRHIAVVNGTTEYATSPATYTLPGGKVALSDAIGGGSAEVVIMAASGRTTTRDSARFRAGGRNLVVSAPFGQGEGSYELFLETTVARDGLIALLTTATEGVVQIRQPLTGVYDGIDAYLAVDRFTEERWSQDGSDPRRLVTIEFAEVTGWASDLTARGFTYGEVEAYYAGISYAAAAGDYPTYLDALQGDFT